MKSAGNRPPLGFVLIFVVVVVTLVLLKYQIYRVALERGLKDQMEQRE